MQSKRPYSKAFISPPYHYFLNFFQLPDFGRASLPGDHMPGVPPVPIPNTAVKPRAANGSRTLGPARVGCCQVYGPVLRKKDRASFFVGLKVARRVLARQSLRGERALFRTGMILPDLSGNGRVQAVTVAQTRRMPPVRRLTGFPAWDSVAQTILFGPKRPSCP